MKYKDIHPTIRQAIGCHEGLRKLGFVPDDIFVSLNPDATMLVVLKTQGKQFAITVGLVRGVARETWQAMWSTSATAVRDGSLSQPDLDRIWRESLTHKRAFDFIAAIQSKGIRIPRESERLN